MSKWSLAAKKQWKDNGSNDKVNIASAFQEDVPMAGNESANESDVPPLV